MSINHTIKKIVVGALLSGGVAAAAMGLTTGTAGAAPSNPSPGIDYSDFAGPIVTCKQCAKKLPGDGSVKINPGQIPSVNIPSAGH